MAINLKGLLSNPMAALQSARQPGGALAPVTNMNEFIGDPRVHAGFAIARGESIGDALVNSAAVQKSLQNDTTYGTTKEVYDTVLQKNVLATNKQIATEPSRYEPAKASNTTDLTTDEKEYIRAVNQGYKGTFLSYKDRNQSDSVTTDQDNFDRAVSDGSWDPTTQGGFYQYLMTTKKPLVQQMPGEGAFDKKAIDYAFDELKKTNTIVRGASQVKNNLNLLKLQLSKMESGDTGSLAKLTLPFKRFLGGFNALPQEELDELGQQDLFETTVAQIVPNMRVVGSGSTSDAEIQLFKDSTASLSNTVESNRLIVGGSLAVAEYNERRATLMANYIHENETLQGFGDYADENLGSIFPTYSSDEEFDRGVVDGELKAGDFVFDAINGQFRILTKEDVRIN
tara:strand:- start:1625 stop:2818 length:1194 start_codon:yes stop_codon:yes gene_type:complete